MSQDFQGSNGQLDAGGEVEPAAQGIKDQQMLHERHSKMDDLHRDVHLLAAGGKSDSSKLKMPESISPQIGRRGHESKNKFQSSQYVPGRKNREGSRDSASRESDQASHDRKAPKYNNKTTTQSFQNIPLRTDRTNPGKGQRYYDSWRPKDDASENQSSLSQSYPSKSHGFHEDGFAQSLATSTTLSSSAPKANAGISQTEQSISNSASTTTTAQRIQANDHGPLLNLQREARPDAWSRRTESKNWRSNQSAQPSTIATGANAWQSNKQRYTLRPRNQGRIVNGVAEQDVRLNISQDDQQRVLPVKKWKAPIAKGPGLTLAVPIPTMEYMTQAQQPPQRISQAKALLVVIDLNGTLLCRTNSKSSFKARKNVEPFLNHLLKHHHVMIWSSSMPQNVENMVKKLFDEEQRKLLAAQWARDTLRLTPPQFKNKVQVYKQLSWIWSSDSNVKRPVGIVWDQRNTVLIDDSVAKAAAEPFNLLEIPEFEGLSEESDVLDQVLVYIEWLAQHTDVSSAIHSRPFKVDGEWNPKPNEVVSND